MSQADTPPAFVLKGSMLAISILQLQTCNLEQIDHTLQEKLAQAKDFFQHIPLVLALDKLPKDSAIDLPAVLRLCQQHGLKIMALRTEQAAHIALAQSQQLCVLPPSGMREKFISLNEGNPQPIAEKIVEDAAPKLPTQFITSPVRSGMQIYAEDRDLVVLAPVSTGAELLADGNIHIWAPMRGRALAGVKGDASARIFCQQLAADLLCIAGIYKLGEDLRRDPRWGQSAQLILDGERLKISPL